MTSIALRTGSAVSAPRTMIATKSVSRVACVVAPRVSQRMVTVRASDGEQAADKIGDNARDAYRSAKQNVQEGVENVKDTARDIGSGDMSNKSNVKDAPRTQSGETAPQGADTPSGTKISYFTGAPRAENAAEQAGHHTEDVGKVGQELQEKFAKGVEAVKDRVGGAAQNVKEGVNDAKNTVQDKANDARNM